MAAAAAICCIIASEAPPQRAGTESSHCPRCQTVPEVSCQNFSIQPWQAESFSFRGTSEWLVTLLGKTRKSRTVLEVAPRWEIEASIQSCLLRLDSAGAHIDSFQSSKQSVFVKQTNYSVRQVCFFLFPSFLTLYFQKFMTGYFTSAGTFVQNLNKNSNTRFGV